MEAWVRACRGETGYYVGAGALEGLKAVATIDAMYRSHPNPNPMPNTPTLTLALALVPTLTLALARALALVLTLSQVPLAPLG
jgi:hypothetical protein